MFVKVAKLSCYLTRTGHFALNSIISGNVKFDYDNYYGIQ